MYVVVFILGVLLGAYACASIWGMKAHSPWWPRADAHSPPHSGMAGVHLPPSRRLEEMEQIEEREAAMLRENS